MIEFRFHTPNFDHQTEVFEQTKAIPQFALFWEMGTGKTKHIIDLASWLFVTDQIDAVLVIAPTGVHSNWDVPGEGLRRHMMPELLDVAITYRLIWHSNRSQHKATKIAYAKLMAAKFAWLIMGVDSLNTQDGYKAAEHFLKNRRVLFVFDESHYIKTPNAQRTKRAKKLRLLTPWRRILTGTPAEQKPFDVYAQIDWLKPGFWAEQGLGSFIAFKHHLADWRKVKSSLGHEFEMQRKDNDGNLVYKNLDDLRRILQSISSRKTKDLLNLPPKIYTRMYYELSKEQRQLYEQMENEYVLWFDENSQPNPEDPDQRILACSAEFAMVRQLRLHQLCLGYITTDSGDLIKIVEPNPALELLQSITEELSTQAIIWCRFRKDLELVMNSLGDRAVSYFGDTSAEERVENVALFQQGKKQFFVATNAAAEGITLTAARTVIYYSNDRRLGKRKQSEDRAHRSGQRFSVQYIDMLAENTISEDILEALIYGEEISAATLGDKIIKRQR